MCATCLRRIIRVFSPDKISNNKLLQDTNQESIDNIIRKRRWRWLGHVMRMNPDIPAKIALTWTPEGKRKKLTSDTARGMARDRRAWKDLIEASCATGHKDK